MKKRHTPEQIISKLRHADVALGKGLKAARATMNEAIYALHPRQVGKDGKPTKKNRGVKRPPVHIPAGKFRIEHPILLIQFNDFIGAGPDKTTIFSDKPIYLVQRLNMGGGGTTANFTLQGGKAGLTFIGNDHHDSISLTNHAYCAGANLYNIHFKDQSFCGIWVGQDPADTMGGAEHDQNKYVQLKFENTGDYGIYMNQSMLDKWLLLNSEFTGQRKAGVRIPFNNVLKGSVIECRFEDIDGPGFDVSGGDPHHSYAPNLLFMEQCDFIECANSKKPAVDYGYRSLSGACRIIIRGDKPILTGMKAALQIYEAINIDIKTTEENAPSMILRGARNTKASRANGHTLRDVKANGPSAFVNDANANLEQYAPTVAKLRTIAADLRARGHDAADPAPSTSTTTRASTSTRQRMAGSTRSCSITVNLRARHTPIR